MTTDGTATTFLTALLVASVAVVGTAVAPVAASQHTKPEAQDVTEEADFEVRFPFATDHYPGDGNVENGSIQYFFSPAESFAELGVEEGAFGNFVIIDADWIDYSACDVPNTAAFGLDRGGNNSGTKIDEDLVSRMKDTNFRSDGLTIEFYDWSDISNNPPYMAPADEIAAEQGARSSSGACLTVTDEPGWYQVQGFLNGTEADNGPNEQPSSSAKQVGGIAKSNYLYVCECDSRAEAEEQLGPPPGAGDPTPTPNETPEPTPVDPGDESTPTPPGSGEDPGAEPTQTLPSSNGTPTPTPATGGENVNQNVDGGSGTPTIGQGPGFGGLAALAALLVGSLLVRRD